MNMQSNLIGGLAVLMAVSLASPVISQEKSEGKAEEKEKKAEKAKAEKVSGDIGLLDTEKN